MGFFILFCIIFIVFFFPKVNRLFREYRSDVRRDIKEQLTTYWGSVAPTVDDEDILQIHATKLANIVITDRAATTSDIHFVSKQLRETYLNVVPEEEDNE